jgi:hypothetical protein
MAFLLSLNNYHSERPIAGKEEKLQRIIEIKDGI